MKNNILLTLFCCLLVYLPTHAQLQKGTGYFGATISLSGSNAEYEDASGDVVRLNNHVVLPSLVAGKFIKDNMLLGLEVGARVSIQSLKDKNPMTKQGYKAYDNEYSIRPFVRNYKSIGSKSKWAVFLTSSADISFQRSMWKTDGQDEMKGKGFSTGVGVRPGIAYWVSPRFALESDINLLSLEAGYRKREESNSFYLRSGVTSNHNGYFSVRASWYIQNR
jgi:hypothetical protein